jgi:LmbE family N-acetylglucosaminyl deacetylase
MVGPALFVQPHYDDVPLSCGGTVAALAQVGHEPRMVTVFAFELVEAMVREFAAWKHSHWKMTDPDEVLATRRAEDAAAARVLGARVRWLGLPDAI